MMSIVSIRVPEEELNIFKNYAKTNNKSLAVVLRAALREKIEDEYDLRVFTEYEKEKAAGKVKTYSHEEVWKELEI